TLQTDVWNIAVMPHETLSAAERRGQILDLQIRDEVVFIGRIPNCPEEADGGSFRFSFESELGCPLLAVAVADFEFRAGPLQVLGQEFHWEVGLTILPAWAPEQIARPQVDRISPQHRVA